MSEESVSDFGREVAASASFSWCARICTRRSRPLLRICPTRSSYVRFSLCIGTLTPFFGTACLRELVPLFVRTIAAAGRRTSAERSGTVTDTRVKARVHSSDDGAGRWYMQMSARRVGVCGASA
jgi:hypothetical protein